MTETTSGKAVTVKCPWESSLQGQDYRSHQCTQKLFYFVFKNNGLFKFLGNRHYGTKIKLFTEEIDTTLLKQRLPNQGSYNNSEKIFHYCSYYHNYCQTPLAF